MSAHLIEVIADDNGTLGDGTEGNPYRRVVSIHTPDGRLIATIDPGRRVLLGGDPDLFMEGTPT